MLAGMLVMLLVIVGILMYLSARISKSTAILQDNIGYLSEEYSRSLKDLEYMESINQMVGSIQDIRLLEEHYLRTRDPRILEDVLGRLFGVKQWINLNLKSETLHEGIAQYRFLQVELTEYEDLVRFILDNPECIIEDEEQPRPGKPVVRISELQHQANVIWEKMDFFKNLVRARIALAQNEITVVQEGVEEVRSRIRHNQRQQSYIMWGMIGAFVLIFVFAGISVQRTLLSPILALTRFARKIGKGEYGITCTPPRSSELGHLANTFNEMSFQISRDITARKRNEEEIKKAKEKAEAASAELTEKVKELEQFNRMAVGREKRMIELKRRINELCEKCGEEPPYDLSFAETESANAQAD